MLARLFVTTREQHAQESNSDQQITDKAANRSGNSRCECNAEALTANRADATENDLWCIETDQFPRRSNAIYAQRQWQRRSDQEENRSPPQGKPKR